MVICRELILGISGLAFAWPCAASPIGPISNVVVVEDRLGPNQDGCRSFDVDALLVQKFFEGAIVITGRQQHDYFLYGPCYARGTLESPYGLWKWELRNLGTGTLESITGDVLIVADPDRESPLSDS